MLDEPTNHLDMETASWLEGYLKAVSGSCSHGQPRPLSLWTVLRISFMNWIRGRSTRYPGNYTNYREQKRKNYEIQMKSYLRQQEEIERQEELIKRFKNKPSKAALPVPGRRY